MRLVMLPVAVEAAGVGGTVAVVAEFVEFVVVIEMVVFAAFVVAVVVVALAVAVVVVLVVVAVAVVVVVGASVGIVVVASVVSYSCWNLRLTWIDHYLVSNLPAALVGLCPLFRSCQC